jgi:hypothetical protein
LPPAIEEFVRDLTTTQEAVDSDRGAYYSDTSVGGAYLTRQQLKMNNLLHLQQLQPFIEERTKIVAAPTMFVVSGVRRWQFLSMGLPQRIDSEGRGRNGPGRIVAMKDGIPENIYNSIAAKAAQDWPGDYEEQAYIIRNQVQAYKNLHQNGQ